MQGCVHVDALPDFARVGLWKFLAVSTGAGRLDGWTASQVGFKIIQDLHRAKYI